MSLSNPSSGDQVDALDAILDKFKEDTEDLWEQFMEGENPDPQKYDDFIDNAYKEAKAKLSALLVEAKVSENEFWADIAIDSKPTQYDFQDRIKELEKQREVTE